MLISGVHGERSGSSAFNVLPRGIARKANMASKKDSGKVGRSSITGKFVTVNYAKSHPRTTEVEKNKGGGKKK